jgi:hypothetical protein
MESPRSLLGFVFCCALHPFNLEMMAYSIEDIVDRLHATMEEFAADGCTHIDRHGGGSLVMNGAAR